MKDKAGKRAADVRQELLTELHSLRGTIRDIGEGFILKKEGEIEALTGYLLTMPAGKLKAIAGNWLKESRELAVKPSKGRIRDLKKVNNLLDDLISSIVAVDHGVTSAKPSENIAMKEQKDAPHVKDQPLPS
jgi:hypothetical protein